MDDLENRMSVSGLVMLVTIIEQHMQTHEVLNQSDWNRLVTEADSKFPINPEPIDEDWWTK
jgi:hypothetical protein